MCSLFLCQDIDEAASSIRTVFLNKCIGQDPILPPAYFAMMMHTDITDVDDERNVNVDY